MRVRALALAALLGLAPSLAAHDLGVARVHVTELSQGGYSIEACSAAGVELPAPVLPPRFVASRPPTRVPRGRSWLHGFRFASEGGPLVVGEEIVLPWDREGAFVRLTTADGRERGRFFERQDGVVRLPLESLLAAERPLPEVLARYTGLGIEHIALGWDHLAFVACLCLIASGWRLARLVTAFTLGHSLTLAAAALGLADVPIAAVEACIALSIAFVAREALIHGRSSTHGPALVATFGLLHGLGFASALADSGIQGSELLPGLLAFNLGVELGQLAFVGVLLGVAALALGVRPTLRDATPLAARALGVLALFWTIERSAGLMVGVA